jgi:hypothetical protein
VGGRGERERERRRRRERSTSFKGTVVSHKKSELLQLASIIEPGTP